MKKDLKTLKTQAVKFASRGLVTAFTVGMISVTAGSFTSEACTSYYAGKQVTADGSILFGRTEDISAAYNKIFLVKEAAAHADGEMYEDGTGFTMPYPAETYRYTTCEDDPAHGDGPFGEAGTNEFGVSMSATESASPSATMKTADPFVKNTGITESSMVSAVLPCVKTAREGIEFLANIIDTYGAGEGNTLMIGDKNECWYMEILTGHQYVAIKMPEDKAALMPNCFMLEEVDVADTENVIASEGLIETAKTAGTLVSGETETIIHVRNSYSSTMKASNTNRIWAGQVIFNENLLTEITPADTDLPMFVTPSDKVSVKTMYKIAGSHNEGTDHEETGTLIGSPRSVECHIFQVRDDMPTELETIEWLCMGSADLSIFVPYYSAAITDTHPAYQVKNPQYDEASAYWTFRSLATLSATNREKIAVNVKAYWSAYMDELIARQADIDTKMMDLYTSNAAAIPAKATNLGMAAADETIARAKTIYSELMKSFASSNGVPTKNFIPSLTQNSIYSTYSFDSTYVDQKKLDAEELENAKAEAEAAKKAEEEASAKAEAAKKAEAEAVALAEAAKKAEAEANAKAEAAKKELEAMKGQTASKPAKKLTVSKKKVTLKKGKKVTIKASTLPSAKISYKSSNKKVAAVSAKGVVKAKKVGTTVITVKANGLKKTVKVIVK